MTIHVFGHTTQPASVILEKVSGWVRKDSQIHVQEGSSQPMVVNLDSVKSAEQEEKRLVEAIGALE
jgi:hypothetical protein